MSKLLKFLTSIVLSSSMMTMGISHSVYATMRASPLNRCSYVYLENLSHLSQYEIKNLTRDILKEKTSSYEKWSELAVVQLVKKRIYSEVKELCSTPSACTDKAIARIVEAEIVNAFQTVKEIKAQMKKFKGLAMLIGVTVGVAVVSQYAKAHIPANTRWVAEFVTIISSIAIYKLGAPIFDYFGGVIYRGAFRMSEGKSFIRREDELQHLTDQYELLQEKMTPFQQQEANRMNSLLSSLESGLGIAVDLILTQDPAKRGIDRGATRVAILIIKMRRFFPEVNPNDDIDVVRTVDMLLKDQLNMDTVDRMLLVDKTMQKIEQYDPLAKDPTTHDKYLETVKRWYGVN